MEKQDIKSMTQEELRAFLVSLGEKPFRTAQIYQWMHEKLASSFDDMTNLSKVLRQKLQDACEYVSLEKVRVQISQIDGTRKYLFRLAGGVSDGLPFLCFDPGRPGTEPAPVGDAGPDLSDSARYR